MTCGGDSAKAEATIDEKKKAKKYSSISAAKKAGSLYYTNKDGKVMAALTFKEKKQQHKKNIQNIFKDIACRNSVIYKNILDFRKAEDAARLKNLNDMYLPHMDWALPPSELFEQQMLIVAKTSNLCVGEDKNGSGKVHYQPCNKLGKNLLWSTVERFVDNNTVVPLSKMKSRQSVSWNGANSNKRYVQFKHNGKCLTVPLPKEPSNLKEREKLRKQYRKLAGKPTKSVSKNSLKLKSCRKDAWGQLWKLTLVADSGNKMEEGYTIRERDGSFCMRSETFAAHNNADARDNEKGKPAALVIYPCTGSPHETFELRRLKLGEAPAWFDHNGVIKSDNGFCLVVPPAPIMTKISGSTVFLQKCKDNRYDRWDWVVEYNKNVKIINDYTGYCVFPYNAKAGVIPLAEEGQLVQRPCGDINNHDWYLRLISADSNFFQLESINRSTDKPSGLCMIPDEYSADDKALVKIFVKKCKPKVRGRWTFGHWKGRALWVEWLEANHSNPRTRKDCEKTMRLGSVIDTACDFWVDKDKSKNSKGIEIANTDRNGVCRVIFGNFKSGSGHEIYPGTWDGTSCSYVYKNSKEPTIWNTKKIKDQINAELEVLTGVADKGPTGLDHKCSEWANSKNGIPKSRKITVKSGYKKAAFEPFLVGGSKGDPHFYLCRQKIKTGKWLYSYQTEVRECNFGKTEKRQLVGKSQVLTFNTSCQE